MTLSLRTALVAALSGLFLLLGLPLGGSSVAHAHTGKQSYVYLQIFDESIVGRVEYPVGDLNRLFDLGIDEDDVDQAIEDAETQRAFLENYTDEHLDLFPEDGEPGDWTLSFGEISGLEASNGGYTTLEFEIEQRFAPTPRVFQVDYDGIIEADPERDAFLLIQTDFGSGTFNNEADEFVRFTADSTLQTIDLDDPSFWKGLGGTIDLGVEHIRIGTDHILFVLALVLPSAMVFVRRTDGERGTWEPSPSFTSSLWRVIKIATMFTIAHSITLAIGGFEILDLSPRLVESIIAISIAIAALHNIHPIWPNREWIMAFGFGLFHGFGFAGLLSELGLTESDRLVSLLGFNLGVEIGQVAIILMVFPVLYLMRRTRAFVPLMNVGSVVLALIALAWATERIFDYDTDVNALVDPVLRWPRSFLVVLAALAFAAGLYAFDRSRNALRPVARTIDGQDDEPAEEAEFADA
jgi:hypothetical protein